MKIGNKLRGLRSEKGFSTMDIAERLDVSESTYRRYESDKSFPDIFTLEKIAKVYDKSFLELLPEEIVINNQQQGGTSTNAIVVNQLSEKLVEQYEARIKNLEEQLAYWKDRSK
ncbi:helix-turn-helix domain-containing protein [Epilithonimonas hungarica]|uniref:DNA-binding transcriptional regulator, XRE-family HTH domain n=1 Tax=Epilithonimonas hungarica TaxID=454006 RepID=A0A1G7VL49_9FLAO|nr:helix-turn-helix transcriptional regulator [Epilithonimonas hungarica]MDP9957847.1 transcriptional regulator with XRE-family HTH domain [Epilithonimonas hungarica]SDG60473.1 DNA-binding transcriptional regulator, XRE-family HTH domain [Epilithonimonas hungarica]